MADPRLNDISLILAKAKRAGFFEDVSPNEVDFLEKEARSIFGEDGAVSAAQSGITNPSALNKWWKALAKRRTTPVKILVTGNSVWEGTGAPDYADRFTKILQDKLRLRYQPNGIAGAQDPNVHLAGMVPVPANPPYTVVGSAAGSQYGLGGRGFKAVSGTTVTVPFTGDRILVRYIKAGAGAILNISLDGGASTLIDTFYGSGIQYLTWDSGTLTSGSHTLVITRDATSQAGRDVYVGDVEIFNGDYSKGIRVYDGSRHGVSANGLYTSQGGWSQEFQNIGGWNLLIVGLGENDVSSTRDQYKADVLGVINYYRTWGFNGSVLIVHNSLPGSYDSNLWDSFGQAEKELALYDPDIAWLDLSKRTPGYDNGGNALGLYYDTKHKNDAGQAWHAEVIGDILINRWGIS